MLAQHAASPEADRTMPLDEILTRLDEIERRLHDALALAQTSCRVCQEALTASDCLRSWITDGVRATLEAPMSVGDLAAGSVERLTPRERDVITLIVGGRSNRQIAEHLFLSPRTIERHIANIYLKLDVHTKVEAAAWALLHGLAVEETGANGSVSEPEDCRRSEKYIYRLHTSTDA